MSYILTYKWSQDHLEVVFSWIRSMGGFNNNPNVRQLMAAVKRLLTKNQLKCAAAIGNCVPQDTTTILGSCQRQRKSPAREDEEDGSEPSLLDEDDDEPSSAPSLSSYVENVIGYIAGFVSQMTMKKLTCVKCCDALTDPEPSTSSPNLLTCRKRRGSLTDPSRDVITICFETEQTIRRLGLICNGQLPKGDKIHLKVTSAVLSNIFSKHP